MFKTELHCHSSDVSQCARVDAQIITEKFVQAGYSTLVLTNHFNASTYRHLGCSSWDEWIEKYVQAYENLRDLTKGRLNILLGAEFRFKENINDYLVFGLTKEFLKKHEYVYDLNIWDFHKLARENGLLVIQAHPFRDGMTITHPDALDGVEVWNGHMGHNSRNDIAELWADKYGLIKTSGTDFHYADVPANSGILTDFEITDMAQLISTLKSGKYELIKEK